jgi:uncharacterized membrane protein
MSARPSGPTPAVPVDLVAVVALTLATGAAVGLSVGRGSVAVAALGFVFLLFAPGYAVIAALFPGSGSAAADRDGRSRLGWGADAPAARLRERGLDGVERFVLSVGASVVVVPLAAFLLNPVVGIEPVPVVAAVGALTLVAAGVAALRRRRLPAEDRFHVPVAARLRAAWPGRPSGEGADAVLNAVLAVSLVFAAGGVGYAAVSGTATGDTEFALLTTNETGGLAAEDYPTEFVRGESKPVVLSVTNAEGSPTEYTTVVELQRVRGAGEGASVVAVRELRSFSVELDDGETWRRTYDVRPELTGDRLRLAFMLYRGDPPENPSLATAYRETHLWLDVSGGG